MMKKKNGLITLAAAAALLCVGAGFAMQANTAVSAETVKQQTMLGASILVVNEESDIDRNGIRFPVVVKDEVAEKITASKTYILPAEFWTGAEAPTAEEVKENGTPFDTTDKWVNYYELNEGYGDSYEESVVYVYNIPETKYATDFYVCSWIQLNDETEEISDVICRSMRGVALAAIESGAYTEDELGQYLPSTYSVTFKTSAEDTGVVVEVEEGNVVEVPESIEIPEGYYDIWYDENGRYDFANVVESDLVLTAELYKGISTLEGLRAINGTSDKYILTKDIDAENATYANTEFIPSFAGVLDGNGFAIKNANLKASSRYWVAGLFGEISGTVQNLKLENITICKSSDNTYTGKAAFLAGKITGTVKNIYIKGTMEAATADTSSSDKRPAYIVSDATGGTISHVLVEVENTVAGTWVVTGSVVPHWGAVYAIGTANGWAGKGSVRDLGGIELSTDASVVYTKAAADLTAPVWNIDEATGVITMVKGCTYEIPVPKYSVTFKTSAEDVGFAVEVEEGSVVEAPKGLQIPEGYCAVWYDENGRYDFSKAVTGNLVLTAELYKEISTLEGLRAINGTSDKYILTKDIECNNATYGNTSFIESFAGVLEGNGYAIKNVKVKSATRYWVAGLFGEISGTVQNLKLENITICKSGDNTYTGKAAFLAGKITGTVKNIHITGTMEASTADTSTKDKRPAYIASDATGGTISHVLIEVQNTVVGTYVVTGGTVAHWGAVYAIGSANGWAGTGTRDIGKSIALDTNAATVYSAATVDLTDPVWNIDATTGVITMVKGFFY